MRLWRGSGMLPRLWLVAWTVVGVLTMNLAAQPVQAQVPLPPIFDPGGRTREGAPLRKEIGRAHV